MIEIDHSAVVPAPSTSALSADPAEVAQACQDILCFADNIIVDRWLSGLALFTLLPIALARHDLTHEIDLELRLLVARHVQAALLPECEGHVTISR